MSTKMTTPQAQAQQTPPATPTSYAYSQYPVYGQMSTYPSPYPSAAPYQTAGYSQASWAYPYGYIPQQHTQAARPNTAVQSTSNAYSSAFVPTTPQRTTTFTPYNPTQARDSTSTTAAPASTGRVSRKPQSNFKGLFTKELKSIMYGFGDDRNPAIDTVNVMEEILIEYIIDVCSEAGSASRRTRLSIEDLRRVLSRPADAKKLARMEELLFMQEDIQRARAQFEDTDINHTRAF